MIDIEKMKIEYLAYRKKHNLPTDVDLVIIKYKNGNGAYIVVADELNKMSATKRKKIINVR